MSTEIDWDDSSGKNSSVKYTLALMINKIESSRGWLVSGCTQCWASCQNFPLVANLEWF